MGPRLKRVRRLASAIIASGVAYLMGEAYVFKAPPGMDADTLEVRFEEASSLRFQAP